MTSPDIDDERSRRRRRIGGLFAFAAIFGISIVSTFGGEMLQSSEAERNRAPDLDLALVSTGEPVRLEQKSPTVLRFVDSSCDTCTDDLDLLSRSSLRWEDKVNYVVISAAASDDIRGLPGSASASIQVASDPRRDTAKAFGVPQLPATVFVTADGQILERDAGALQADELERRTRSVIAEGPG